jgi:DNA repair ATPase RecN
VSHGGNVCPMAFADGVLPAELVAALRRPSGARFHRVALQVNPYAYLVRHAKATLYQDEQAYNAAMVDAFRRHEIKAIAVTDHFRIETSERLAAAARTAGIVVFPSFEAASKEGVHLLFLFDPDRPSRQIERIIGECGVHSDTELSPLSNLDAEQLLAKARDWRAVVIAAHVTSQAGGLLRKLSGQSRVRVWKSEDLQAISIPGAVAELQEADQRIVANTNHDYRRDNPVAVLNAGDVCDPGDLSQPRSWSWIKMTDLSLDGLRQAILDPDSRIRLASDPVPEEHTELVALAWRGGFLDGLAIGFSENLNVLVGGRGTGKTTVIESLRYVLGLAPLGDEARRLHDGVVRGVLQSGTRVSLLARTWMPTESCYLIERTVPNPPVVRNQYGDVIDVQPLEILPGIEIYGQREISELAKSPERLTKLLDRFVAGDGAADRKTALQRELARTRGEIVMAKAELASIEDRLAALPGLEDTLRQYREAGVEDRLREQSLLVREERVLDTATERMASARERLAAVARDASVDLAFVSESAIGELPAKELLSILEPSLEAFNDAVTAAVQSLLVRAKAVDAVIEDVRTRWRVRQAKVMAAYEQILRDLQRQRVDGDEFIRLRRRIEELAPLRDRQQLVQRVVDELEQRRRNQLAEWEDLQARQFQELRQAAKAVTRAAQRRIRVSVQFSGNREPLAELLRTNISGRFSEAVEALKRAPALSLRELAAAARNGATELVSRYGIPPGQADKLAHAPYTLLMEIEELDLPPTTEIDLNTASDGQPEQWQALDSLSTGQRATAVLLLLLHDSAAPLVIDQPEDDLDNRFITEGIVPRLRSEKRRRQFVFSSHNANIPVLGDAELILGLTARGEGGDRGHAEIPQGHAGSIDSESVRKLVEEILEGGRAAFEMRRRKYGF